MSLQVHIDKPEQSPYDCVWTYSYDYYTLRVLRKRTTQQFIGHIKQYGNTCNWRAFQGHATLHDVLTWSIVTLRKYRDTANDTPTAFADELEIESWTFR